MFAPVSATPWSRLPGVEAWPEAPTQRFEMKYLAGEDTARARRAFLRRHHESISKLRAHVHRDTAPALLTGPIHAARSARRDASPAVTRAAPRAVGVASHRPGKSARRRRRSRSAA
jgi:hypothetical protein